MPVEKGSPAYAAKFEQIKKYRARHRRDAFLRRSIVKKAVKQARIEVAGKWKALLDDSVRRRNKFYRTSLTLRNQITTAKKETQLFKRWERVAESHLKDLQRAKARIVELEEQNKRLPKQVSFYKRYLKFLEVFWASAKMHAQPKTWRWLCTLWRRGPKPSADLGWGGGQ